VFIVNRLNQFIGGADPDVVLGNMSMIDQAQDSEHNLSDRVIVSVVNIEQESTLRNLPGNRQQYNADGSPNGILKNPGILLNVYLVIAANKTSYQIGLQRISQVITFFNANPVLSASTFPALRELQMDKITFEMYTTPFEELNQLWGIMGGKYMPSVIYKARLIYVAGIPEAGEVPLIRTIETKLDQK